MHSTAGYTRVAIVDSGPLAVFAGLCPLARDGTLVRPGDISAQVDQIIANATVLLDAARARAENVVRSVIYVVSDDPAVLGQGWNQLTGASIGSAFTSASTLLGVAVLGYRDQLVEVDLTAAVD